MARKRVPPEQKITKNGKIQGRPIEWDDELIDKYTEHLDEWSSRENSIMLTRFCVEFDINAEDITHFELNNKNFAQALKRAKLRIAARREEMVNSEQINYGVFNRYQAMYDPFIYKHERAEKIFEAELKRQIVAGASGNVTVNITDYGK